MRDWLRHRCQYPWLLVQACVLLFACRRRLRIDPARTLNAARTAGPVRLPVNDDVKTVVRAARAIRVVGRRMPGVKCLVEALAGKELLERNGVPVQFSLGVAQDEHGVHRAHAWLECRGRVVLGSMTDLPAFSLLTAPTPILFPEAAGHESNE